MIYRRFLQTAMSKLNWKTSTWPTESKTWADHCKVLLTGGSTSPVETNLNELNNKSVNFPIKFPIIQPTCQHLQKSVNEEILQRNIKSAYPIIHEHALYLYADFLNFKKNHGSVIEKEFYKNMTVPQLIDRLLLKRAVSFICASDMYVLLDKSSGNGGWENIGTVSEKPPLILENCLSYDEIKLSALLSVSSYSYFLNKGDRANGGQIEKNREILEEEGIVIGLIGTRLEKKNVMEYEEIIISQSQNTPEKGYSNENAYTKTKLFFNFYESESFTYKEVQERIKKEGDRFVALPEGLYFDNVMYTRRLAISFDTVLLEANFRAKEIGKYAFIHIVGIGLGVWKISSHQAAVFVNSFFKRTSALGKNVHNVSDIYFAYISNLSENLDYKNGDVIPLEGHPLGGVKIHISKREPFTNLHNSGKLLVVTYAWDGNALPGNEFWGGDLFSTGDASTAASSQIAELHNPHINKMVCHSNLMVATLKNGVIPFGDFVKTI